MHCSWGLDTTRSVGQKQQGHSRCYLHGAGGGPGRTGDAQGGGPWDSGVPEPLLTVFRMSEILGAGVEQNRHEHEGAGHTRAKPMG